MLACTHLGFQTGMHVVRALYSELLFVLHEVGVFAL